MHAAVSAHAGPQTLALGSFLAAGLQLHDVHVTPLRRAGHGGGVRAGRVRRGIGLMQALGPGTSHRMLGCWPPGAYRQFLRRRIDGRWMKAGAGTQLSWAKVRSSDGVAKALVRAHHWRPVNCPCTEYMQARRMQQRINSKPEGRSIGHP